MELGSDFSHTCSSIIDGIINILLFLTNIMLNPYPANVFVLKMSSAYYVCCIFSNGLKNMFKGVQWLSGRVLDSSLRGRGRHCFVSLSKTH